MSAKRLIIPGLLVVSLGFNLGFLAGSFKRGDGAPGAKESETPTPAPRHEDRPEDNPIAVVQRVARELELDEEQRAVFADLHEEMRTESAMYADSADLVRAQVLEELRRPEPNLERVRMLIAEELELQHERRENAAELFHAFLERLTLDQRRELAQRLMRWPPGPGNGRERGMGGRGGGRLGLRAFDLDDDGRLDESELEAARSAMTQRWERHRERRERELRRRFDADADGELNPEERASMEDAEARRRQAIEFRLHKMLLERFDTDGDGALSKEELRPVIDWLDDPPPPPPPGLELELPDDRPGWRGRGPRGEDRRDRWWDRRSGGAGPGDRRDRDADRDDASGGTDATDL